MIKFDFFKGDKTKIVLALGFFDCIHVGHLQLFEQTKALAKTLGAIDSVFTFENDYISVFKGSKGLVNTYEERIEKFEKLKINSVISTVFTKEFSNISADEFIELLFSNFNICGLVCGADYKFGKRGLGNKDMLETVCKKKGVRLCVVDDVYYSGEKVSTTLVKKLLSNGEVKTANSLLFFPYEISGEVIKDRQVGRKLGFPTANVLICKEKAPLKLGVYKTELVIDGVKYNAVTNYGSRPTYNLEEILTETYIDGFSGNLYGKRITISFVDFLRDCVKFESEEQLKCQLKSDLEKIK